MSLFPLKPTHAPVKAYYAPLAQFHLHGHTNEGNTRSAFADLLKRCAGTSSRNTSSKAQPSSPSAPTVPSQTSSPPAGHL